MPFLDLPLDAAAVAVLALSLKGSLLLTLALGAALWLRRGAAAHRHAVWVTALAALLVLPLAGALLPGWYVPLVPAGELGEVLQEAPAPAPAWQATSVDGREAASPVAPIPTEAPVLAADADADLSPWAAGKAALVSAVELGQAQVQRLSDMLLRHGWALAGLVWLLGMGWLALRWGGALLEASRIVEEAEPVSDAGWQAEAREAARAQGVRVPVRLLHSDRLAVPVAWTLSHPAVVLPADAEEWDAERRRVVLAHEMAHVARQDGLTQLLAQAAVLVHWFNPLAWLAYHRVLEEREQACDDRVLMRGARPSAYAQHLVELARRYRQESLAVLAMAPMARPTGLEARVRSILDPTPARATASRRLIAGTTFVALALVGPLAAFQPLDAPVPPPPPHPAAPLPPAPPPLPVEAPLPPDAPPPPPAEGLSDPDWTWSGTVRQGGRVEVYGLNGNVRATRGSGSRVEAQAERRLSNRGRGSVEDVRIVVNEHSGGVVICAVYPGQQGCEPGDGPRGNARDTDVQANFVLSVPDGVSFASRITNGNVQAQDLGGDLVLQTTNGNVSGETRRGDVHARTTNGNVRARAAGLVRAETTNGNIEAHFGRADWSGTLRLATTNGSITAALPASLDADLRARVGNGGIRSAFDVPVQRGRYTGAEAEGQIGRGGRTLELAAQNGSIRLERTGDRAGARMGNHSTPHAITVHPPLSEADVEALTEISTEAALLALDAVEAVDWEEVSRVTAEAVASVDWEEIRAEVSAALEEARLEIRAAREEHARVREEHGEVSRSLMEAEHERARAAEEVERALREMERVLREAEREERP